MAQLSDSDRLRHMFDFAVKAREFSKNRKRGYLDKDELFALAMARLLEMLGEAASRVSRDFQERHQQISWKPIIGMRNRLTHGYDTLDYDIIWDILKEDLAPLIRSLKKILAKEASLLPKRKTKRRPDQ